MASCIGHHLIVELQWETLLGLDKEAREIRDLCARRAADRYVIVADDQGLRHAGLIATVTPPTAAPCHALAAVLNQRANGHPLLYLGRTPERSGHAIVIGINAGRPDLDRWLPIDEAIREAQLFAETLNRQVRFFGDIDLPGIDRIDMALPAVDTLSTEERAVSQIRLLNVGGIGRKGKLAIVAGTFALGGGLLAWTLWPDAPAPVATASAPVDPMAVYQAQLRPMLATALASPGAAHAQQIVALLGQLPMEAGDWHVKQLHCVDDTCELTWQRRPGATLDTLLDARPDAIVQEGDFDTAIERISLTLPSGGTPALRLLGRRTFLDIAGSRAQQLRDYGMEAEIGVTAPLLPLPPLLGSEQGGEPPPVPAKGDWRIGGHLAFIDSLPGLLRRAGNMALRDLQIDTDAAKPHFSATGEFYVE